MSRAHTNEEASRKVMDQIRAYARYWAAQPCASEQERCDGLAFSILNIFDGTSVGLPAFDIVARPHPDDKAFNENEGENYWLDGMVLEGVSHELFHKST